MKKLTNRDRELIKALRLEGVTQKILGKVFGVHPTTIGHVEQGKNRGASPTGAPRRLPYGKPSYWHRQKS